MSLRPYRPLTRAIFFVQEGGFNGKDFLRSVRDGGDSNFLIAKQMSSALTMRKVAFVTVSAGKTRYSQSMLNYAMEPLIIGRLAEERQVQTGDESQAISGPDLRNLPLTIVIQYLFATNKAGEGSESQTFTPALHQGSYCLKRRSCN